MRGNFLCLLIVGNQIFWVTNERNTSNKARKMVPIRAVPALEGVRCRTYITWQIMHEPRRCTKSRYSVQNHKYGGLHRYFVHGTWYTEIPNLHESCSAKQDEANQQRLLLAQQVAIIRHYSYSKMKLLQSALLLISSGIAFIATQDVAAQGTCVFPVKFYVSNQCNEFWGQPVTNITADGECHYVPPSQYTDMIGPGKWMQLLFCPITASWLISYKLCTVSRLQDLIIALSAVPMEDLSNTCVLVAQNQRVPIARDSLRI